QGAEVVAFSPDGRQVAVATGGGLVMAFDAAGGQEAWLAAGHLDLVTGVALLPEKKGDAAFPYRLASCSHDRTVRGWRLPQPDGKGEVPAPAPPPAARSAAELLCFRAHRSGVTSV